MRALLVALLLAGCLGTPDAPPAEAERGGTSAPDEPRPTPPATPPPATPPPQDKRPVRAPESRFAGCAGSGTVEFQNAPMRMEDVQHLVPYGLVVGAHVTPIDHMYFAPLHGSARDAFEVRAIADGVIYAMQPRDVNVDAGGAPKAREWRMDIAHTCTFVSYFDLLTSLAPDLEAEWNKTQGGRLARWEGIPVAAGQVVGRIGAQTLDFGVYDHEVTLPGLLVAERYDAEPWKVHTVDPFPHFQSADREAMLAKMLRLVEPRAGKIDHDVDGRIIGNWFAVGTNGYRGIDPRSYWEGHLAIVPDHLDPTQVRFSVGNWSGKAAQFGVKGNTPLPETVGVGDGVVKYELVRYGHVARDAPERRGFGPTGIRPGDVIVGENFAEVQGTALVELVEPRLLRLELFPGRTAGDVTAFTPAARLYER